MENRTIAAPDSPRERAQRYPAGPGGPEEYKRSTRSPAAARSAAGGDAPHSTPVIRRMAKWCDSGSVDVAAAPEYLSSMRSPETDPFSGSTRLLLVFAADESTSEFLEVRQQIDARSGELSDRDMIAIVAFSDREEATILHAAGREVPTGTIPPAQYSSYLRDLEYFMSYNDNKMELNGPNIRK